MIFSKACEYGIRAAIYVAQKGLKDERCSLKDISEQVGSPEAFTAKILQKLVRAAVIKSNKGAAGGFGVDAAIVKKIKLADIIIAIDGSVNERHCALGLERCSEDEPCPVHNKFKHIKRDLVAMIYNTTLYEMAHNFDVGKAFLKVKV